MAKSSSSTSSPVARASFGCRRILTLLLASTVLGGTVLESGRPAFAQATAETANFQIPAQSLPSAINAFIRQSGWQISYSSALARDKTSTAVNGNFSPDAALRRLVAGTGIEVHISAPGSAALTDPSGAAVRAEDGSILLGTIYVDGESAWGPVDGYVANNSAAGMKTDTPLIETPASVTVIGREEMEDRGVQSVTDAISYTPGVVSGVYGPDNGMNVFSMRGFMEPGQFQDGLAIGQGGDRSFVEPYGLERLEILRGPASVLYGQSEPGGMVSMVSKRPTEETIREIGLFTTQHGGVQGMFDFGGKLNDDGSLLYRFTGLGKHLGTAFTDNTDYDRLYLAPSVTWRPTKDTTLTIMAQYQRDPGLTALIGLSRQNFFGERADGWRQPQDFYPSDPWYDNQSLRERFQIGYAFEHHFNSNWTIRQNARYLYDSTERHYLLVVDDSGSDWTRRAFHSLYDGSAFQIDTHVEGEVETGSLKHTLLFGIDYGKRNYTQYSANTTAGVPTLNIYKPVYGVPGAQPAAWTFGSDSYNNQAGVYFQDQIKWDRWTLLLGGRYDWTDWTSYNPLQNNVQTYHQERNAFTKRVGLVYEFDNGIAPYISYAESFRPLFGTSSPERGSIPFEPTRGRQWEAGIKYEPTSFDGLFTFAVYDLVKSNVRTADPDNPTQGVQTGEIRTRGLELSAAAHLTSSLSMIASYSYQDALVLSDNPNYWGVSNVGKVPVGVPEHQASLWLDYTFHDGLLAGLGLGGGLRFVGSTWADAANSWQIPSSTVFDAALRYDFGKANPNLDGLNLSINVTNLFNSYHLAPYCCYQAPSRTVSGSLTYRW